MVYEVYEVAETSQVPLVAKLTLSILHGVRVPLQAASLVVFHVGQSASQWASFHHLAQAVVLFLKRGQTPAKLRELSLLVRGRLARLARFQQKITSRHRVGGR